MKTKNCFHLLRYLVLKTKTLFILEMVRHQDTFLVLRFHSHSFVLSQQDVAKPSDPFMNMATVEIKGMLIEKYRRSEYAAKARARIQELSTIVSIP